ncbi:conserved hypothetical protein [Histoplasma capsulatum H143]|uniref:DUF2461 domain-containing protein n=1 Tax=Ajellomyces capsulatus (strain H143) TaxID=544712 RepID=C6HRW4_AJECH|nr:conserved hypothetical protein [Histoplasma capsulatum H143]
MNPNPNLNLPKGAVVGVGQADGRKQQQPHRALPGDAGDTLYEDHTIHPNTMLFLKDLKANNQREWLKMHDADFRTSKRDWDTFVESLTEKIIEKDSTIPELPAKDLVFRIYRDIRFSNDPTPYKPHFSAAWYAFYELTAFNRTDLNDGAVSQRAELISSGLWHPEAEKLALLRRDIDQNSLRIKNVLNAVDVREEIFNGIPKTKKEAVLAFVSQNQESALKTKPKTFHGPRTSSPTLGPLVGSLLSRPHIHVNPRAVFDGREGYDADNKNIDLLRLRSFTMSKKLQDKDLLGPTSRDRVARIVGIMEPFVTYLNSVVMPDPPLGEDHTGDDIDGDSDHSESGEGANEPE